MLAEQALPADAGEQGFVSFELELNAGSVPTDLCLQFTGDTRPQMWVIDQVELVYTADRHGAGT